MIEIGGNLTTVLLALIIATSVVLYKWIDKRGGYHK
jgi:hypothetical protein